VVARLKPGVAVRAAEADLRVIAAQLERQQQQPGGQVRIGVRLEPLADVVSAPVRRSLWMLFAAVTLVLAAACANVANLLLARMAVRVREVVTRAALGAGHGRLARQFLAESLCLGLAGGAGGLAIAWWGTAALARFAGPRIPRAHEIGLDWQAFAFLLAACVGTAVLFGLAPALFASRTDAHAITKDAGGHATLGRRFARLRDALVIVEVTLAFVLACVASVVIREVVRLRHVDTGMATDRVAVLSVTPRVTAADYQAIEDRVAQVPNVRAAGFIQMVPLQNWGWEADFSIDGRPADPGMRRTTELRYVTPGYFNAMGIRLLRGRGFTAADTLEAPRVIVINDALARRYFPGEDPVSRKLDRGLIVGVIADVRNVRLDRPPAPELYYAAAQNLAMTSDLGMSLIVQADTRPEAVIPSVRGAIAEVRPALAVFNTRSMVEIVDNSLADLNLYRWLIGLFAALALLLSAVGLFGVISYMTASRTREFAIRIALGSRASTLAGVVMRRSLVLGAAGAASGAVVTALLSGVLAQLPIGGAPAIGTYVAIAAIMIGIATLAAASPALRAATVDPAVALRQE
jgi:predicted permease